MIIIKQAMQQYGIVGDKLGFSLTVTNNEAFTIQSVMIYDILEPAFMFVQDSLKINDEPVQGSPEIGITLGDLEAGNITTIVFDVEVVLKNSGSATNQATGSYLFLNQNTGNQEFVQVESEEVTIQILDIIIEATKQQDRDSATIGDIVNYTINIYNSGDLDLINIRITDVLSKALELQQSSIRVNGMANSNYDLQEGILIPMLKQGAEVIVSFTVTVKGCGCSNYIPNTADIRAQYILPDGSLGEKHYATNTIGLYSGLSCFKQIVINKDLKIPNCHSEIEDINDLSASIRIDESYVVNTMEGQSIEGQVLTGRKIVVNGIMRVVLNYTGLIPSQMVFAKEYEIPFGAYLIMPIGCEQNTSVDVAGIIEQIHYSIKNSRELFISASILLRGIMG